jgi:hypothetical protein
MNMAPNPAVEPVPSGRWTLRDKDAQRRSPLRSGVFHTGSSHGEHRSRGRALVTTQLALPGLAPLGGSRAQACAGRMRVTVTSGERI